MEIFKNTNFDFLGNKWPFIIASLVLTAAGLGSLLMKGGPRYGIDFNGGTSTSVAFATDPNEEEIRRVLSAKIPGEIVVQKIQGQNEVMIGSEVQDEKQLNTAREAIYSSLAEKFNPDPKKMDINNSGQAAIADQIRDGLGRAGVNLSDNQLQDMVKAILQFRDSRQGIIPSFDSLSGVAGVTPAVIGVLKNTLTASPYNIRHFDLVGPKVGRELRTQALTATLLALTGMLIYVALRFELVYGAAAVIAVFHDTIITVGLFSLFNKQIDLPVIAALLTLVGFSMNDTIVVFDRIRENLKLMRKESLYNIINASINQTLSRTILTSGLTLLTALSLYFFGGPVLHGFSFALVFGILVGTYSSIFVASPILVAWQEWAAKRKEAPGGLKVAK